LAKILKIPLQVSSAFFVHKKYRFGLDEAFRKFQDWIIEQAGDLCFNTKNRPSEIDEINL